MTAGKGGVGKTTLTANLGVALTSMGFKTCVLDANFTAPDLAIHFGLNPDATLWDVLKGEEPIENAIYEHDCGLHLIPGSTGVEKFKKDVYKRLERKTRGLKYDFLLIDTPPGLGSDAVAALIPAEEVVIVTNPEWTSLSNAYRMYHAARGLEKQIVGLVMNRQMVHEYEPGSEMVKKFTGMDVVGQVPEDVRVRKSIAVQSPLMLSYPESQAAEEMEQIAAMLGGIEYKRRQGLLHRLLKFMGIA